MLIIGNYELQDWALPYPNDYDLIFRLNKDYNIEPRACVWLREKPLSNFCAWTPKFSHELYFLNEIFENSYGPCIYTTQKIAMEIVDEFLIKMNKNKIYW